MSHSRLFTPLTAGLRSLTARNAIVQSPMCMYSAVDGVPNDWHEQHLVSRAVGGVGVIIVEATGVSPIARISPSDTGLWNDTQQDAWARIVSRIKKHGAVPGIQLAHAGRKASTAPPWQDGGRQLDLDEGGWETVGPTAIPFSAGQRAPRALSKEEIHEIVGQFRASAIRARAAGFELVEVHAAHGYLLHEFMSPLCNHRTDEYGGSFENRVRFPIEVAKAVREAWPQDLPVWVRISATDWMPDALSWDVDQSVRLARELKALGVDLVDVSSGGAVPNAAIKAGPGYQVPFAARIRREADVCTGAVGLITDAHQAEAILQEGSADAILIARELLRNPYWPLHAAAALGEESTPWPAQYERARIRPRRPSK